MKKIPQPLPGMNHSGNEDDILQQTNSRGSSIDLDTLSLYHQTVTGNNNPNRPESVASSGRQVAVAAAAISNNIRLSIWMKTNDNGRTWLPTHWHMLSSNRNVSIYNPQLDPGIGSFTHSGIVAKTVHKAFILVVRNIRYLSIR